MINKFKKLFPRIRGKNKNKVFIAMWMDDKNLRLSTAIKEALNRAGYEGYRIDDISHNNQITEEIFSRIKKSPFIVADFTHDGDGPRGSVFYEAGFARGAGIEVIHTCKNIILKKQKLSFDTSQFPHVTWKNLAKKAMEEFVSTLSQHIIDSRGRKIKKPEFKQEKTEEKIEHVGKNITSGEIFFIFKDNKGRTIAQKVSFPNSDSELFS